ncbi:DEAD/DEAH box helicase [Chryseobacterium sp. G0186]|uniref:Z1 domain-containing protein n=1 Tax=Chryseobacterium sp. G0186 TaxID=2487064 RepID=UPI000F4FFBBF|nr:Z1 domain-containing protein [Chryseobacterium sp. G0186]AZA78102.1 DEAD/DEAH box helicase [Chryseobacterium sp. G0186]
MNFSAYEKTLQDVSLSKSTIDTSDSVVEKIRQYFTYNNHLNGLLLGNVQSGKTIQTLGVIAKMADNGFNIFLFLTTDNVYLQKQTFERTCINLPTFQVFGEYDDVTFSTARQDKPIVIVLKKNTNILRKWRNNLSSSQLCSGQSIVIIDDEADSASLNNLVNKKSTSTINRHLSSIKSLSSSSIYIQVTATPQAILLQSQISGWKSDFVTYFSPGANYIGGEFVYSDPQSYCIRITGESELDDIKDESGFAPQGLIDSVMSFLITASHFRATNKDTCNFLIHPSVRIADQESFADKIGEHLNFLLSESEEGWFEESLYESWKDLQKTKPDITNFDDIKSEIASILEIITIIVVNSKSPIDIDYNSGFNIIIGGNSLGRGVTIPKLQTVYYCRKSKSPQADTFWQHSRMFGYDREAGVLRVFIPQSLHKLFKELNGSNSMMIKQILENGLDGIQLIYTKGINPTRKTVLDKNDLNLISGGVNFFPNDPIQDYTVEIDALLNEFGIDEKNIVDITHIQQILKYVGSNTNDDWDKNKFLNCVNSLSLKRPQTKCYLIVRRNRDISKGTGTLLSPTDRILGDKLGDSIVLTMYKIQGGKNKGWNDKSFWIPNIKFPNNLGFYDVK